MSVERALIARHLVAARRARADELTAFALATFATQRKDEWHADCGARRVPYRDSSLAIRERIAELERERKELDRQVAALRGRLADLAVARSCERLDRIWKVGERIVAVVAIAALVLLLLASAACIWSAFFGGCHAEHSSAETSVKEIRRIAMIQYRRTRECPTPERLAAEGRIDEDSSIEDPWGNAYRIDCSPGRVVVSSAGPDEVSFTEDDITSPRALTESDAGVGTESILAAPAPKPVHCEICGGDHDPSPRRAP